MITIEKDLLTDLAKSSLHNLTFLLRLSISEMIVLKHYNNLTTFSYFLPLNKMGMLFNYYVKAVHRLTVSLQVTH